MKIVADAGPLMAFAKIGGLETLFRVYPKILTPPAVHEEAVMAGLRLGAPDAALLEAEYEAERFEIRAPERPSMPVPAQLGRGEEESIRLALDHRADWILMDDLAARRAATDNIEATAALTQVKGTLGIIVSARMDQLISGAEAIQMIEAIERRPDIWIHTDLCRSVVKTLQD